MTSRWCAVCMALCGAATFFIGDAAAGVGHDATVVADRPNIIFLMVDDERRKRQNFLAEGRDENGRPLNITPHLDRLAAEGTVLPRAYAATPVCIPSRFACLTGTYPSRAQNREARRCFEQHGYPMPGQNTHILPETQMLPKLLKRAGYFTGAVGKNHVVEVHGFEKHPAAARGNQPETLARMQRNHDAVQRAFYNAGFDYADRLYHDNLHGNQPRGMRVHNLDWITDGALEFIDRAGDRPFFLYFASTTPHGSPGDMSWKANRKVTSRGYLDEPLNLLMSEVEIRRKMEAAGMDPDEDGGRAGVQMLLDDALGRLFAKLEAAGKLDNTVIAYFNDHGKEGSKADLYESAMRSSAVFWGPGVDIAAARRDDTLTSNVDFAPTFLRMAGLAPASLQDTVLDGVDLTPMLRGDTDRVRDTVYGEIGYARAVVGARFKYIALRPSEYAQNVPHQDQQKILNRWFARRDRLGLPRGPNKVGDPYPHIFNMPGGSDNNWPGMRKYPHYFDQDQLYDLESDPQEQVNLADNPAYAEDLARMRRELSAVVSTLPGTFGEFSRAFDSGQTE
ncbi:MAG: sulfatase-like hydrolase/transferase [Planctomycetota bacterium]